MLEWYQSGGPIMYALTAVGILLYFLIAERFFFYHSEELNSQGRISELNSLMDEHAKSTEHMDSFLEQLSSNEENVINRNLVFIKALVAISVLLGLLGTVTGIILTFSEMLNGNSPALGSGISQALVTTQYGLMIAVPGVIFEQILNQKYERVERQRSLIFHNYLAEKNK